MSYAAVLSLVQSTDIRVKHHAHLSPDDPHGDYRPPFGDRPAEIRVFHPTRCDVVEEPADTVTLAHEYGHHLSLVTGERTAAYNDAIRHERAEWRSLPESQRMEILTEEQRAWAHARVVLANVGFSDWDFFEARRREGQAAYCDELGLSRALAAVDLPVGGPSRLELAPGAARTSSGPAAREMKGKR